MDRSRLCDALSIGGVFGNLIKSNATISGAVGGCQAEVGTAVSMAAASAAYLMGLDIDRIEYAAEIAMEHNLGLTCDPVMGYVMIPCIERNAMGVLRAFDAATLSRYMSNIRKHLVSFDMVVETMKQTGMQIPIELRETAEGGLAKEYLNES
jgi:L-serine dehydratase